MPTAPSLAELDDALELLYFAFREVVLEPDRILARRGLGRVHHRVLFMCRRNPGMSVGELVHVLGVTKQALHRPLKDLYAQALLVAVPDPHDKRISRLALSAKGRALEARLSGLQREIFARAFATAGAQGARAFATVARELGKHQTSAAQLRAVRGEITR